ncbi:hypothetical protein Vretimale_15379 [Volvox reticuliferus]|uniref:Uncharacterized protein n=1 Tax=Volvox reticuliferus TaxID=1737510 RepID=A0A8J4GNY3_9CHLO|nr:hypothetical protein Vretimale_15379 [Volvox reticuliferus]
MAEASLSGSQRLTDKRAGSLGKGLKQIAADIVHLFLKDKSPRGIKRESRAGSPMWSTRTPHAPHVRDGVGAANSGFSPQHSRSSLPRLSEAKPEFELVRDALSDDGSPGRFNLTKQKPSFRTSSYVRQMPITDPAATSAASMQDASKTSAGAYNSIDQLRLAHPNKALSFADNVSKSLPTLISRGHAILRAVSCVQPKFVLARPVNVHATSRSSGETVAAAYVSPVTATPESVSVEISAAPLPAAPSPPSPRDARDAPTPAAAMGLRHHRQEFLDEPKSQIQIQMQTRTDIDKGACDAASNSPAEPVTDARLIT